MIREILMVYHFTYDMFPERLKGSAVLLANSARGFMSRVVRGSHVLHQVLNPVELPEACSTLVPDN